MAGCGKDRPVVVVRNLSWPDGSVVSIIQDGLIADRSTLYGDYVRLRANHPGLVHVRSGEQNALTWLSKEVLLSNGEHHIALPALSIRRRTEGKTFGLSAMIPGVDSINKLLFENPVPAVTTLTLHNDSLDSNNSLRDIASAVHAHAVEIIVSLSLNSVPENRPAERTFQRTLDTLETAGIDGILLTPERDLYAHNTFFRFVRFAAREIHLRGMTVELAVPDSWPEKDGPDLFFRDVPAQEAPDMIRIAASLPTEENLSPDTVLHIERLVGRLIRDGVPEDRISAELALSAAAFVLRHDNEYEKAPINTGEIDSILPVAGMTTVVRLRDGTLRLGYGGRVYSFEDVDGLTEKLRRLNKSPFSPKGGVHILYDARGITLDRDGLKHLTEAYNGK